jgi:predicted TIM-barrel enzyme
MPRRWCRRAGDEVANALLEKRKKQGDFLVGAAIGAGALARAAIRGGADFLVVLNAVVFD